MSTSTPGPTELPPPTPPPGPHRADPHRNGPGPSVDLGRLARDVAGLAPRVLAVEDRIEGIAGALDDLEAALTYPAPPVQDVFAAGRGAVNDAADEDDDEDGPGLDMRVLVDWVGDNIADLLERRIPQTSGFPHWCPRWWLHPEAITRFEALRRLWTVSVGDPEGGLVVYFGHLDQMLAVLGSEYGPFSGCSKNEHRSGTSTTFLGQQRPATAYFAEIEGDLSRIQALPATGS